jgi:hypothetical protein
MIDRGERRNEGRPTHMKSNKQSKVVDVDRGLVLVRYATAGDEIRPPKIEVLVNPKDEKHIEIISNPLHSDAVLREPGGCLVVRAMRPGKLFVEVIPIDDEGSTAATVKVEMLSQGELSEARSALPTTRAVGSGSSSGVKSKVASHVALDRIKIIGHVAGIGDVTARADEWVAGPSAPARIEGLSIVWPGRPDDLDIRYCVKLARPHAVSGRMMELGAYAGTRGRALPIVGIRLEMSGAAAAGFRLFSEAAFLGAPIARTSGKQIEMSGPTGREPLVGFRLRLDEIDIPLQPVLTPTATARSQGRVRVFRSRAAESQLHSAPQSLDAPSRTRAASE